MLSSRLFCRLFGLALALLPAVAPAQVFYSEDFQDGNAASRWTVSQAGGVNAADFAFDYSTLGIPLAPNGTGTIGLKLEANLGPTGASSGIMAFPDGQSFSTTSGSYTLLFDVWMNVQSTTGSTELAILASATPQPRRSNRRAPHPAPARATMGLTSPSLVKMVRPVTFVSMSLARSSLARTTTVAMPGGRFFSNRMADKHPTSSPTREKLLKTSGWRSVCGWRRSRPSGA